MVTVFLSSCEKNPEEKSLDTKIENFSTFELPKHFDNLNSEEVDSYFKDLTVTEKEMLTTYGVEFRGSCGNWSYMGYGCYRRWCGPPGNGGYQYCCP